MNKTIEDHARKQIKDGLAMCTDAQKLMFKRMYSHTNLEKDINQVVDDMPTDKLDHALSQVERTLGM
jgi:hypothetical protein